MESQHADFDRPQPFDVVGKIAGATLPSTLRPIEEARRAVDHAIRSIFELATSLEFLSDAIRRFNAESNGSL